MPERITVVNDHGWWCAEFPNLAALSHADLEDVKAVVKRWPTDTEVRLTIGAETEDTTKRVMAAWQFLNWEDNDGADWQDPRG